MSYREQNDAHPQILEYLHGIVSQAGLTRSERKQWIEEMGAHILEDVEALKENHEESVAVKKALENFGEAKYIRKQLMRQLVGLPSGALNTIAGTFFALFLFNMGVLMTASTSEPMWVYQWITSLPSSPALMLGLSLTTLMLRRTRCRRDRLALLSIPIIFGIPWIIVHVFHEYGMYQLYNLVSPGYGTAGNFTFSALGGLLLFVWPIMLYTVTRNAAVSRFPVILAVCLGLWVPVYWAIQFHLWQLTHVQAFWGHYDPFLDGQLGAVLLPLIYGTLLVAVLIPLFRRLDRILDSRKNKQTAR